MPKCSALSCFTRRGDLAGGPLSQAETVASINTCVFGCRHLGGATPTRLHPDWPPGARGRPRPPRRCLGCPLRAWGRAWRRATNASRPGRRPPAIPWAWWTKPFPSRTSSRTWCPASSQEPSAGASRSPQPSGQPRCPPSPRRGPPPGAPPAA